MLILTRRVGETLMVGDDNRYRTRCKKESGTYRCECTKVSVHREEIYMRIQEKGGQPGSAE